jgi:hypothetical protein
MAILFAILAVVVEKRSKGMYWVCKILCSVLMNLW